MLLVARYRAAHMAAVGFFAHTAPGATVADLGREVGGASRIACIRKAVKARSRFFKRTSRGRASLNGAEYYFNHDPDPDRWTPKQHPSRGNVWFGAVRL